MSVDPAVLTALETAVRAAPDSLPLRLHLAELLLQAGRAGDALEHFAAALKLAPGDAAALKGVGAASAALGAEAAEEEEEVAAALTERGAQREHLRVLRGGLDAEGPDEPVEESPKVTLADVGGMQEVKRRLDLAFLAPMRNPELRKAYGKSLRGGVLLYGPPGCGKTFLARALAGEIGARFYTVGIPDVMSPWQGESEIHLHEVFETARRNSPAVVFFDEIDALGHKRSQMRGNVGGRNVVNVMLAELDGVGADNEGVFMLAATNHPWDVDTALRRPGRLDRMVLVLPPDADARKAILRYHLRERPAEQVDVDWVAGKTEDFSGADLAHLCESATELALEAAVASGRTQPITTAEFKRALKDLRPSTRAWFDTARNYAMFANEGGMYDELLAYIKRKGY